MTSNFKYIIQMKKKKYGKQKKEWKVVGDNSDS